MVHFPDWHLYTFLRPHTGDSLVAPKEKTLLVMQGDLGLEDPLEKRMATHCSILA